MKTKDVQEQNYIYFRLGTDFLLDEYGRPKRFLAYPQVSVKVELCYYEDDSSCTIAEKPLLKVDNDLVSEHKKKPNL